MSVFIFNAQGERIAQYRNLAGMNTHARTQGGVTRLQVFRLSDGPDRPGGFVVCHYTNGAWAETYFTDGRVMEEWAFMRRSATPKRSWFAGCTLDVQTVAPGQWDYDAPPGHKGHAR